MLAKEPIARSPYAGSERRFVIAIDVGTTFSGASYTILEPGQVPKIYDITRYEGQEDLNGSSKVPSVLYYSEDGELLECGPTAKQMCEADGGFKVEWFKLLLRPERLDDTLREAPRTNLPPNKTVVNVFADFLRYMLSCVERDICDTFGDGPQMWNELRASAQFILTHPNGWEGAQQTQMRQAVVKAGLVSSSTADEQIEFVTEGEASFHFCVDMGWASAALDPKNGPGKQIIIVDAGGGTIDISSFKVTSVNPLRLEEEKIPVCLLLGSVFVTRQFKTAIRATLRNSEFGTDEKIDEITEVFDKTAKRLFRNVMRSTHIRVGGVHTTDLRYNVRNGQLSVPGRLIADAFHPSCKATADAVNQMISNVRDHKGSFVFLTGGLGASPWLQSELKAQAQGGWEKALRCGGSDSGRAVARGAIAYHLDRLVVRRVARHTLGIKLDYGYDPTDKEHLKRSHNSYVSGIDGERYVKGGFKVIVAEGEPVDESKQFRENVFFSSAAGDPDIELSIELFKYSGSKTDITFCDMDDASTFQEICTFRGTASAHDIPTVKGSRGRRYHMVHCAPVLELGKTALNGFVEWMEEGVIKRGKATLVWTGI